MNDWIMSIKNWPVPSHVPIRPAPDPVHERRGNSVWGRWRYAGVHGWGQPAHWSHDGVEEAGVPLHYNKTNVRVSTKLKTPLDAMIFYFVITNNVQKLNSKNNLRTIKIWEQLK